jgi:hypothetical protein
MPDVYAAITTAQPAILDLLINVLELRASDPRQREMRDAYLSRLTLSKGARILEAVVAPAPLRATWQGASCRAT